MSLRLKRFSLTVGTFDFDVHGQFQVYAFEHGRVFHLHGGGVGRERTENAKNGQESTVGGSENRDDDDDFPTRTVVNKKKNKKQPDRCRERVKPLKPAIRRRVRMVANKGRRARIHTTLCAAESSCDRVDSECRRDEGSCSRPALSEKRQTSRTCRRDGRV